MMHDGIMPRSVAWKTISAPTRFLRFSNSSNQTCGFVRVTYVSEQKIEGRAAGWIGSLSR
jgi:hypothetical protein